MKASLCVGLCLLIGLICLEAQAQQPDSGQTQRPDSVALQAFLSAEGPAELAASFFSPPPYRFNSGVYAVSNPAFPLLFSPDSLVRQPMRRAHRQRRTVQISAIATAVSLVVLSYATTHFLAGAVAGKSTSSSSSDVDLIHGAGIATLAGLTVTISFNIASRINTRRGIRRHNEMLGRRMPTLFNPKGL